MKTAFNSKGYALHHDGLLSAVGYHVGNNGQLMSARRETLDRVMQSTLPKVISPNYIAEWREPKSQDRLKKLADSIAAFRDLRLRKIRTENDEAIRDWTNDLEYLKSEYWDGSRTWRW